MTVTFGKSLSPKRHVLLSKGPIMKLTILTCVAAIVSLCVTASANADFIIEISNVVATAGTNVSVNVTASSTAGEDLLSIDNPLDFGAPGLGELAGFTFLGATEIMSFEFSRQLQVVVPKITFKAQANYHPPPRLI